MAEMTAMRKRQKIQGSNKQMFLWVTAMSVVVGFSLVIAWFLVQQITFKASVYNERSKTLGILRDNNAAVDGLRKNVRVLDTNQHLLATPKAEPDQKALQIILDALPADANSLALGASLERKIIADVDGVQLDSMEVQPTASELASDSAGSSAGADTVENGITFRATVSSSSSDSLRELLHRFERSIRVIDITNLQLERSENKYTMTIDGTAYYQPPVEVKLTKKVVRP